MNKLILVRYEERTKIIESLFNNTYEFNKFFNPFEVLRFDRQILDILPLEIKGKTYKEKANNLHEKVLAYQDFISSDYDIGLSWLDVSNIENWLDLQSKRYGKTREFKENAIC